jgi:hypothetical protein
MQLLLSEKNLVIREEACRIGLLFGGFTGCYHFMRCLLRRLTNQESDANRYNRQRFSVPIGARRGKYCTL